MGWTKAAELTKVARSDGKNFDCAAWMHKARSLPRDQFKREVDQHLTGKDTEPTEIIYFKFYKSQIPVIEQAIETAALMLGSDKSRGYCLEMICADFLAGANLDSGQPDVLLSSMEGFSSSCPANIARRLSSRSLRKRHEPIRKEFSPTLAQYEDLRQQGYAGTVGGARVVARCRISRAPIGNCGASLGMMPSRTSLRFALDATQSCIGERIDDRFVNGNPAPLVLARRRPSVRR